MKEADDSHRSQSVAMQIFENVYRFGLGAIAGGLYILLLVTLLKSLQSYHEQVFILPRANLGEFEGNACMYCFCVANIFMYV